MPSSLASLFAPMARWHEAARRALYGITLIDVGIEIDAGAVRAEQLKGIVRLTPWMILGALLNCAILVVQFWSTAQALCVAAWGGVFAAFSTYTLLKWNAARRRPALLTASKRAALRAVRHASILGALWGFLPVVALGAGSDMDRALIIVTIVGMSASGSFVLAVLPAAALAHLAFMLLPMLVAMALDLMPTSAALAILIVNYFVVLSTIIMARYGEFVHRLRDRHKIEQQAAALTMRTAEASRAAEMATEANKAKSQFLAHMSHEIRTPMNGILGLADLLERGELTDRQRACAETISRSSKALLAILNGILDFSRIEAGHLALSTDTFNLAGCIEGVAELLSAEAKRKGLALTVMLAPDLPKSVIGDDGRLRQVLINLIGNAIKFTEQGHVTVDARITEPREDAHVVRIQVSDSGIGMAPATRERLFNAFEQGDSSITRRFGGTGLGLSISKSLIEAMGGTIEFESEVGTGTTATFTVMLGKTGAVLSDEPPAEAASPPAPVSLEGLKVLVAEDNPVNQMVAQAYLEGLGCRAHVVDDGSQALQALGSERFDLVMMDCQMPVMDGFSATRAWRAMEAERGGARIPVIAVTANAFESDRCECLKAGMDDFLSKPFRKEELVQVLMRWRHQTSACGAAA